MKLKNGLVLCGIATLISGFIPVCNIQATEIVGLNTLVQQADKEITLESMLLMVNVDSPEYVRIYKQAKDSSKIVGQMTKGDTAYVLENPSDSQYIKIKSGRVEGYINRDKCVTGIQLKEYIQEHQEDFTYVVKYKGYQPIGIYEDNFSADIDTKNYEMSGIVNEDTFIYNTKEEVEELEETETLTHYIAKSPDEDRITAFKRETNEDSDSIGLIEDDSELELLEDYKEDSEWTKVFFYGCEGYIRTDHIIVTTTEEPINNVVESVKEDFTVKVTAIDNDGWCDVETEEGNKGYIKIDYLDMTYEIVEDKQDKVKGILGYNEEIEVIEWDSDYAVTEVGNLSLNNCIITIQSSEAELFKIDKNKKQYKPLNLDKLNKDETTKERTKIAKYAQKFLGNPYVWGGTSLTKGTDCSGFTQSVLAHFDIHIDRVAADQAKNGKKVKPENIKVGDLVFYADSSGYIGHVAMYIGKGKVIHASNHSEGIKISKIDYRGVVAIRNVID